MPSLSHWDAAGGRTLSEGLHALRGKAALCASASTACACVPGVRGTVVVSWGDEKDTMGCPEGRATIGWIGANQRLGQLIDGAFSCSHVREGSLVMAQDPQGFARAAACRGATRRNEAAQVSAVCLPCVCCVWRPPLAAWSVCAPVLADLLSTALPPPQPPTPPPCKRVSSEGGSRLSCQINHAHLNLTGPAGC